MTNKEQFFEFLKNECSDVNGVIKIKFVHSSNDTEVTFPISDIEKSFSQVEDDNPVWLELSRKLPILKK